MSYIVSPWQTQGTNVIEMVIEGYVAGNIILVQRQKSLKGQVLRDIT